MITNIKIEKIMTSSGVLGAKIFTPVDITNELEMPIIDNPRLDGVLDTTQISLLNSDKEPLKPFTRIKIELSDADGEDTQTEYIYRLVEFDNATNIVGGNQPLYRHTIGLIEPTKLLERKIVDNLTFTNFIDDSYYGFDRVVDFSQIGYPNNASVRFNKPQYTSTSDRFVGPNRLWHAPGYKFVESDVSGALEIVADADFTDNQTQVKLTDVQAYNEGVNDSDIGKYVVFSDFAEENTISTNIELTVSRDYYDSILGWVNAPLALTEYKVTHGSSTSNLIGVSTFTFREAGEYVFTQIYSASNAVESLTLNWRIRVVETIEEAPKKYTILSVLQRLLSVYKIRRQGLEEPEFVIDENLVDMLESIPSPEFSLTQGTLFEALQQIGDFIHAIPRLIPDINDDYGEWNVITFDFLGGSEQCSSDNYSTLDSEYGMEDYCNSFISNIQNATKSNYNVATAIVEPYIGGYMSTRTESSLFEVSNDECLFKTRKPIRALTAVWVSYNGQSANIVENVVEKSLFDTESAYSDVNNPNKNKAFYLYYTKGQNNIYNLTYLRPNQTFFGAFTNTQAIKNILKLHGMTPPTYLKDLNVQVQYVPYENFKLKQYKSYFDSTAEDTAFFYNQQANELDIEVFGQAMAYALLKTGNKKASKTQYFQRIGDMPKCGMVTQDNYYAFAVNREIYCNTPIKATISWSKDYNELFSYNAIKKTKREYEIDDKEVIKREPDYQEFCVVDTELDVERFLNDESLSQPEKDALYASIVNQLSTIGFGGEVFLNNFAYNLSTNHASNSISCAVIKTYTDGATSASGMVQKHCFLMPVSANIMGRSVVLHFAMDDNYSAGTQVIEASGVDTANLADKALNSYAIEDFIPYSNEFGRFEDMHVAYFYHNPIFNVDAKALFNVNEEDINHEQIIIDYYARHPFHVAKDSRERIGLTTQLNFGSTNANIIIGMGLVRASPLVGVHNSNLNYKYVLFTEKPNKFNDVVDTSKIEIIGSPSIEVNHELKYLKVYPEIVTQNAVGYGFLDSDNKLCVYVDDVVESGSETKPIYLMFRVNF